MRSRVRERRCTWWDSPLCSTLFLAISHTSQVLSFHSCAAMAYSSISGSWRSQMRTTTAAWMSGRQIHQPRLWLDLYFVICCSISFFIFVSCFTLLHSFFCPSHVGFSQWSNMFLGAAANFRISWMCTSVFIKINNPHPPPAVLPSVTARDGG